MGGNMRLRNKKTGEIKEVEKLWIYGICPKWMQDREEYHSLAELNEDWEDYEPVEPLIKDEKIRKAVRAWADVNGCDKLWVKLWEYCGHGAISFYDEDAGDNEITFKTVEKFGLKHLKSYTITELCGEEEE